MKTAPLIKNVSKVILALYFISDFSCFGQNKTTCSNCSVLPNQGTDSTLYLGLERIYNLIQIPENINIIPCSKISTFCCDYIYEGEYITGKVIFYNPDFFEKISKDFDKTYFSCLFLSHEYYHFIKIDPRRLAALSNAKYKIAELDADRYAGKTLYRLKLDEDIFIKYLARLTEYNIHTSDTNRYPKSEMKARALKEGYYDAQKSEAFPDTALKVPYAVKRKLTSIYPKIFEIDYKSQIKQLGAIRKLAESYSDCSVLYRILGEVKLEIFESLEDSLKGRNENRKFIDQSIKHLRHALKLSNNYPAASLLYAEALLKRSKITKSPPDAKTAYVEASKVWINTEPDDIYNKKASIILADIMATLGYYAESAKYVETLISKIELNDICNLSETICLFSKIEALKKKIGRLPRIIFLKK